MSFNQFNKFKNWIENSDMKYYGAPLNRFLAEVNTCQLLCRNCHDIIDGNVKKLNITMI